MVDTNIVGSGKPMLLTEVPDIVRERMAHDDVHAGLLRAAGFRSMMVAPLTVQGRTFGAITFAAAESGWLYSPSNFQLAQQLQAASLKPSTTRVFLPSGKRQFRRGTQLLQLRKPVSVERLN